jgi:hypothetical protein
MAAANRCRSAGLAWPELCSSVIKISDAQMAAINIQRDPFHGDWNYIIHPATVITS